MKVNVKEKAKKVGKWIVDNRGVICYVAGVAIGAACINAYYKAELKDTMVVKDAGTCGLLKSLEDTYINKGITVRAYGQIMDGDDYYTPGMLGKLGESILELGENAEQKYTHILVYGPKLKVEN